MYKVNLCERGKKKIFLTLMSSLSGDRYKTRTNATSAVLAEPLVDNNVSNINVTTHFLVSRYPAKRQKCQLKAPLKITPLLTLPAYQCTRRRKSKRN